jgi:hypothetical protein
MKKSSSFRLTVALTLLSFLALIAPPLRAQGTTVRVPAGTSIMLTTVTALDPAGLHVGDPVNLNVASDVVIGGKVVFKAGAAARGEITSASKRGMVGAADKVALKVLSVDAVDGTAVAVSANKVTEGESKVALAVILGLVCLPLLFVVKGGAASIPAGSSIGSATNGLAEIRATSPETVEADFTGGGRR